ncbi:AAA family ATPase [Lachnospiraceae bacterium]|nr:AAA family ATPase [Lachnospiraceae bacterium]
MLKRPLPIGIEFYKDMINKPYYYVDKTLMIKDILDKGAKVNLFTRPRRFGKTLALSMLRTFFEQETDQHGTVIDNSPYFDGTIIQKTGESYICHMGQYPVVSLSLKSAKQPGFQTAYACLKEEIAREFSRHNYLLQTDCISMKNKEKFQKLADRQAEISDYSTSLKFLSECLQSYHKKNVMIFIDEYDVPLENSYFRGFYEDMADFIRSLFESALKTNECLELAVITGCLRISKESIFTGLNNLEINSVMNADYAEYFGFTDTEVEHILDYYGLTEKKTELQEWYNGYLFGNTQIYNPWSVINYVKSKSIHTEAFPKPYWANTSSNSIIRELIEHADHAVKQEIEDLIEGKTIVKPIHEDITYEDIYKSQDNLWNFLFFTGYLNKISESLVGDTIYLSLAIPNTEVRYIYRHSILEWFQKKVDEMNLTPLYQAVLEGNTQTFSDLVSEQLTQTISFFDYAENYYHGFLCGLLKGCPGYITLSNREHGNGRPDIVMKTPSVRGMAIIMELKVVKDFEQIEAGCETALQQIAEQNYETTLYKEGFRKFIKYGICFYRKECLVKTG